MVKRRFARSVMVLACVASLLGAGAFSATGSQNRQEQTTEECYLVTDEMLRQRVIAALRAHRPPIAGIETNFRVRVRNRLASVEGTVQSSGDKRAIYEIARRVPCIDYVNTNELKIACAAIKKARQNAIRMLAMGLSCKAYEGVLPVRVELAGGGSTNKVAILTGIVPSDAQKAFAESLAKAADCVDEVRNRLTVSQVSLESNCRTVTDEQLREKVETAIKLKLSCIASNGIRVTVSNKIVTLTGATFLGARQLAIDAAEGVECVEVVVDQLGEIGPACPVGARTCTTLDGEQWCCVGCGRCPLN